MNGLMSENESETGNRYWSPPIYAVQWADSNFGENLTSTAYIRQILTLNITQSGGRGGGVVATTIDILPLLDHGGECISS